MEIRKTPERAPQPVCYPCPEENNETRTPEPETRKPKVESRNLKPVNLRPGIRNGSPVVARAHQPVCFPKPEIRKPEILYEKETQLKPF